MTSSQPAAPTAAQMPRAVRIVHGAMIAGLVLFLIVAQFVMRPARAGAEPMAPALVNGLLALGIVGFVLALVLRRLVPKRLAEEPADAYWMRANGKAIVSWAPLEFGSLLAIVAYSQSGSTLAAAVAVVGIVAMGVLNPASLERR